MNNASFLSLAPSGFPLESQIIEWTSILAEGARLEGLNGLFQAARARARGYRNTETFMTMIYLIASPAGKILEST